MESIDGYLVYYFCTAVFETIDECGNQMLPAPNFDETINYLSAANV